MNFHIPSPSDVEQEAVKIVAWILEHPNSEITYSCASENHAKVVAYRVEAIMLGSPFRVAVDNSKWLGIWGTNG